MFGSTTEFFYRHLAGIQQAEGAAGIGYRRLRLRPSVLLTPRGLAVCANLSAVNATLTRMVGVIRASWACDTKDEGATGVRYSVSTPVGVGAEVHLPLAVRGAKTSVTEGGKLVFDGSKLVPGVDGVLAAALAPDGASVVVEVASGSYAFSTVPRVAF